MTRTFLRSSGVRVDAARLVRDARRLPGVVRAELAAGADLLIVGGGDGTVNCAVGALVDRRSPGDIALGVLPLGTANDFPARLAFPRHHRQRCARGVRP